MSGFDDYPDDMMRFATFSDEDVERLLGGTADAPELADLASFVEGLRREAAVQVDEVAVRRYVSGAAAVTAAEPGHVGSRTSMAVAVSDSEGKSGMATSVRLRRALAATVSAVVLFGSVSGVAMAADDAGPGDGFYGIDRALERVGIGNGGAEERLEEARALAERGDVALGLRHAAAALEDDEVEGEGSGGDASGDEAPEDGGSAGDGATSNAGAALLAAAETVRSAGSERSQDVRDGVAALLTYLSENVGAVDGAMVASLARDIGRHGPPGDAPGAPPVAETPVAPAEEPMDEPPVVAVDEPLVPPADEPVVEPPGQPGDRPVGPPADRPVTPPVEEPPGQPGDRPVGPPEDRPVTPPVEEPPGQPGDRPAGPPEDRPVTPPVEEPPGQPGDRPVGPPEDRPAGPSGGGAGAPGRP